jgi:hypothetical protein
LAFRLPDAFASSPGRSDSFARRVRPNPSEVVGVGV